MFETFLFFFVADQICNDENLNSTQTKTISVSKISQNKFKKFRIDRVQRCIHKSVGSVFFPKTQIKRTRIRDRRRRGHYECKSRKNVGRYPPKFTVVSKSQTHLTHQKNKKRTKFFQQICVLRSSVLLDAFECLDAMNNAVDRTRHKPPTHMCVMMILTELSEN